MMGMMPDTNSQRNDAGGGYAHFLTLGFTFVSIIGGLTLVGYFADRVFGTLPLFLLIGLVFGFVGSLTYVYRALKGLGGG
jgi:F0F1-type ATP synthase assembly protein I